MTYLAGTYDVTGHNSPNLVDDTHTRGTVIIDADGSVDLDAGNFLFTAADVTEFYDRSNLTTADKRFDLSFGFYNNISPNATLRLYLDSSGNLINIKLQTEANSTTIYNLNLSKR